MSFSLGGFLGGAGSGAAAGSAFGPIGTAIGAIGGGLFGGIGGGAATQPPEYKPTELQENLSNYGQKQVKATRATKDRIISEYESMIRAGNRGAAENFLEQYVNRYSNSKPFEKALAKSYQQDIDYSKGSYWNEANELYKQQNLGFSPEDFASFADRARGLNIRSPQAFSDMLKQQLIAGGKVMTPQQEQLSLIFGDPYRDETGRYKNYYRALQRPATPGFVSKFETSQLTPTT